MNCIKIEGIIYNATDFTSEYYPHRILKLPQGKELCHFLKDWWSQEKSISLQTSGSTGTPKLWTAEKEQMVASAILSCNFFKFTPYHKVLLCLSMSYIAAKMLVVRAIVAGFNLCISEASSHPFAIRKETFDFVSLVPTQCSQTLKIPQERELLSLCSTILLGGASIAPELEQELQHLSCNIYSSYGMTETLSHIALRQINGSQAQDYYTTLDNIDISISSYGTLTIDAPSLCNTIIQTNDLVEILSSNTFRILGRLDNVIISGGIKLHLEIIENKIQHIFTQPFALTSKQDEKWGEILILLHSEKKQTEQDIRKKIQAQLSTYEIPKKIIAIAQIPITSTGKINRKKCTELVNYKTNITQILLQEKI